MLCRVVTVGSRHEVPQTGTYKQVIALNNVEVIFEEPDSDNGHPDKALAN